tara:strand:+ start:2259 stop:2675 length:417 start_codon:yes stop_codon:yes gene_type:complete
MSDKSFNDKLVARTVLPAIYLWLLSCGAVVYTGIMKPDVVLQNLEGFIALIAIIGGVASPAFNTLLRTWEAEQAVEVADMPVQLESVRGHSALEHQHMMFLQKQDNVHKVDMERHPHREDGPCASEDCEWSEINKGSE